MRVYLQYEKETKGAVRYKEVREDSTVFTVQEGAILGTLYVRKTAWPEGKYPNVLKVDITTRSGEG